MKNLSLAVKKLKDTPKNETIVIVGKKGSGKTTLLANIISKKERFVLVDTKKDFDPFLTNDVTYVDTIRELVLSLNKGISKIIFRLSENIDEIFSKICKVVFEFQRLNHEFVGNLMFGVDEVNRFCEVRSCVEEFEDIILRGRSIGIGLIMATQWFTRVPAFVREQINEFYIFRLNDRNALNSVRTLGIDEWILTNLGEFECIHVNTSGLVEKIKLEAI